MTEKSKTIRARALGLQSPAHLRDRLKRARDRGDEAAVAEITKLRETVRIALKHQVKAERQAEHEAFIAAKTATPQPKLEERRYCYKHGKLLYADRVEAHEARLKYFHDGGDPGATLYSCGKRGWHFGHPGGWKSLERRIREANGTWLQKGENNGTRYQDGAGRLVTSKG